MLHWSKHNVMLPENGWLLLSNSLTDRTLQYCWLITMISRSACFTSYPFISNQWLWMIQSRPTSSTCYDWKYEINIDICHHLIGFNLVTSHDILHSIPYHTVLVHTYWVLSHTLSLTAWVWWKRSTCYGWFDTYQYINTESQLLWTGEQSQRLNVHGGRW